VRILWSSNSPFAATGYGQQTACAARRLKDMGHDIAILAFYGLQGSRVDWGDIPIYPNPSQDWGIKSSPMFYKDWKADILITLVDVWVMGALSREMHWCLPFDAIIETDRGCLTIGEIVEGKLPVKVYGYKNGKVVSAEIEAWQRIPYCETGRLVNIKTESQYLTVTGENEILTFKGWKAASEIKEGNEELLNRNKNCERHDERGFKHCSS